MPNAGKYVGDSGRRGPGLTDGSSGVATQTDEGHSTSTEVWAVAPGSCVSGAVVEQYHKIFERENLEVDPHTQYLSASKNGDNTPYADQHAPIAGPQTPGPQKGS